MKKIILLVFGLLNLGQAEVIRVFAAADLQYALREIAAFYHKLHPEDKLDLVFGSSGKGYAQIRAGAPFHLFFSANMEYVQSLYMEGLIVTEPKVYAVGRIVLWTRKDTNLDLSRFPEVLLDPKVRKIAIANWEHAPYGKAAKEVLENHGIFRKVRQKLVVGENVSQAASFVYAGTAELGIIALSLAKTPQMEKAGKYWLIPEERHKKLIQGYGITKEGLKVKQVKRFYNFVGSPEARKIFLKYGFMLTDDKR
ncbi:MAG: molybdate ABC transporter substrate-binding protein [Aquificaceae bacterium]|nr:molybdate ABC transporter substrate-binding protein [Aquificaceae bacterium]